MASSRPRYCVRNRSIAPGTANCAAPRPSTKYPRRTRPDSSAAFRTGYTAENPPVTLSATTAPRVTTPYRSSSTSASATARRVGSASGCGRRDHRPAMAGGAVRAAAARPCAGPGSCCQSGVARVPAPRSARGVEAESCCVTRQAASGPGRACRWSASPPTRDPKWQRRSHRRRRRQSRRQRHGPPAPGRTSAWSPSSASSSARCNGSSESDSGSGSNRSAVSVGARTIQPSWFGSDPAPAQTTSPASVSSSSHPGA